MPERQFGPTDRGFVIMRPDSATTVLVIVCAAVDSSGNPSGAYAAHRRRQKVSVRPGIRWRRRGSLRWSQQPLETYYGIADQTLYIRPVTNSQRLAAMVGNGSAPGA